MIVKELKIAGIWGRQLRLSLNRDVNFLIGVNGSGKTTVINLLAAVLKCDLSGLDRSPFTSATIRLVDPDSTAQATVHVDRRTALEPVFGSTFSYKFTGTDYKEPITLDVLERGRAPFYRPASGPRPVEIVRAQLRQLVNTTWVSVHRASITRDREEGDIESAVDKKLGQLTNNLIRHFSMLAARGAVETEKFQHALFLSLLNKLSSQANLVTTVQRLKLDDEEAALVDIFESFKLMDDAARERIREEFSIVRGVAKGKGKLGLDWNDIIAMVGMLRIHSLVQDWRTLVAMQAQIFASRDDFFGILGSMMPNKQFSINAKNELAVKITGGSDLPMRALSSGEKQLLIILGEAFLQDGEPWIYIADEPELSLHVAWQEQLIAHIRKLNPKSQVIFATHSPDIVSQFDDKVFDMEKLIK